MHDLRQRVEAELLIDILPFWLKYSIDDEYGGFRGRIANDLAIEAHGLAPHLGVLIWCSPQRKHTAAHCDQC